MQIMLFNIRSAHSASLVLNNVIIVLAQMRN